MRSGSLATLVDTNVLVYSYDVTDKRKQQRAIDLLRELERREAAALSAQILGEFYNTVTRKLPGLLSEQRAAEAVSRLARTYTILPITSATVLRAIEGAARHQRSYWDALVWATARENGIPLILSEDMSHGQVMDAVRVLNPFAPDFVLPA